MNRESNPKKKIKKPITGTYITQPISQADNRDSDTNVALPDDPNVAYNRDWSIENKL